MKSAYRVSIGAMRFEGGVIALSIVQQQILWSKVSSPIVRNRPKNSVWNSGRLCQSLPHWRNYWRACFSRHLPLRILGSIPVPHSHPWAYTSNTSHSQFLSFQRLSVWAVRLGSGQELFSGPGPVFSRFSQGSMTRCWKVKCHLWSYIWILFKNLNITDILLANTWSNENICIKTALHLSYI